MPAVKIDMLKISDELINEFQLLAQHQAIFCKTIDEVRLLLQTTGNAGLQRRFKCSKWNRIYRHSQMK
jgi:hypothetical protein